MQSEIIAVLRELGHELAPLSASQAKLGQIKHFGVLVPAAQDAGVPLREAPAGSPAQRQEAARAFDQLAEVILRRVAKGM